MQAHRRRFTDEEKQQLLDNLDIEVAHRVQMLESRLADSLAAFRDRHERQITYIPKLVRSITMAEFGDKYNGDVQAALLGIQKEKLGFDVAPFDRTAMKRKWTQDSDGDIRGEGSSKSGGGGHDSNPAKAVKNPRTAPASPHKKPPFLSGAGASRHTANGNSPTKPSKRAPSPGPHKAYRHGPFVRPPSRPASPSKASAAASRSRVPSSATFAPTIPKTPAYPSRYPRKHESMLSVNGSPLANPYELGLDWLATADSPGTGREQATQGSSKIIIRPDASTAGSRSNSQSSTAASTRPLSSQGSFSARVAVPTRDGHMLEFDPLLTSPVSLDRLEGITDSAKKQAKEDMAKLLQQAMMKWTID